MLKRLRYNDLNYLFLYLTIILTIVLHWNCCIEFQHFFLIGKDHPKINLIVIKTFGSINKNCASTFTFFWVCFSMYTLITLTISSTFLYHVWINLLMILALSSLDTYSPINFCILYHHHRPFLNNSFIDKQNGSNRTYRRRVKFCSWPLFFFTSVLIVVAMSRGQLHTCVSP